MVSTEVVFLRELGKEILKTMDVGNILGNAIVPMDDRLMFRSTGKGSYILYPEGERSVFLIGIGKAASTMTTAVKRILDSRKIDLKPEPIVIVPEGYTGTETDRVIKGGHPFPGRKDIGNMERLFSLLSDIERDTVIILLLSGGASSLMFHPREGVDPEMKSGIIRQMILNGADICELNTVRTFLSDVKGGGLLCRAPENRWETLILSDVMGDDPRFIGSGPTYPWDPDPDRVEEILRRTCGKPLSDLLRELTISSRLPCDPRNTWSGIHIAANNSTAVGNAASVLTGKGYRCQIRNSPFSGEARAAAFELLEEAREKISSAKCDAYIAGGETTVDVKGDGKGGRNSEMIASIMGKLEREERVLCIATDGIDGSWNGAGGFTLNGDRVETGSALGSYDTGTLLIENDRSLITGPTGNNLGDLFIYLLHRERRGPPLRRK